ncbi:MAG: adenosine-specific kinase [Candidatus Bathyarchaeia archaeon]
MEIKTIKLKIPESCNVIIGQSHFIKTVEDLHEAMANCSSYAKFGLAFCESSGPCLVRHSGNDKELEEIASKNALEIAAGHCFVRIIKDAYPVNFLNSIKLVPEVCNIYCATANPVEVIVAESELGRAILGVIDGHKSKGIEGEREVEERKIFLRKIGYKL